METTKGRSYRGRALLVVLLALLLSAFAPLGTATNAFPTGETAERTAPLPSANERHVAEGPDWQLVNTATNMVNTFGTWLTFVLTGFSVLLAFASFFGFRGWKDFQNKKEEILEQMKQMESDMREIAEANKKAQKALDIIEGIKRNIEESKREILKDNSNITTLPAGKDLSDADRESLREYNQLTNIKKIIGEELTAVDYLLRGNTLFSAGKYEKALDDYDNALKIKPDYHEAWNNRGSALDKLEKYEEALKSYEEALKIKPDYHEAWYNRGIALRKLEKYEEAIKSYEEALKIKPDDHEAWYNRGNALHKLEKYEEALKSYEEALKIKPDDHEVWYNKACLFSLRGDKEAALANLAKAIAGDAKYKEMAHKDEDFRLLWEDGDFRHLVE